ncbi:MAG: hypothetical protein V3V68_04845 [Nitrosomonadaceae bacterium]
MKIKGKKIEGVNVEIIPIPRGDRDDIIFMARAIQDMEPFEKMCPLPNPPKRKIDGVDVPQLKDPNYLKAMSSRAEKRMAWMTITALEATEGLEWENVKADDPSTWLQLEPELKKAGFSAVECQRIVQGVVNVNALSEEKIEAARERFLLSQRVASED